MKLDEMIESLAASSEPLRRTERVEQSRPLAEGAVRLSMPIKCEREVSEHLDQYPIGKAISELVSRNDLKALRFLQRRVRMSAWKIPPFDSSDKESAVSEHLWDTILKKTGHNPLPEVVLHLAMGGQFEIGRAHV